MKLKIIPPEFIQGEDENNKDEHGLPEVVSKAVANCLLCKYIKKINQYSFKCGKGIWDKRTISYASQNHNNYYCLEFKEKYKVRIL